MKQVLFSEAVMGKVAAIGIGVVTAVLLPKVAVAGAAVAGLISFRDMRDLVGSMLGSMTFNAFKEKHSPEIKKSFSLINDELANSANFDLTAALIDSAAVEAFYSDSLLDYSLSLGNIAKLKDGFGVGETVAEGLSWAILNLVDDFQSLSEPQQKLAVKALEAVVRIALREPHIASAYQTEVAHQHIKLTKELVEATRKQAQRAGLTEAGLIELARLVTDKYFDDPQQALVALEAAFERFIEQQANGSGNLEASLQLVISEINERTKQGRFQEAQDYGSAAYEEEKQASKARQLTLVEANLSTALIAQNVDVAVKWIIERLKIEHGAVTFYILYLEQEKWYQQGHDKGIYLDLEVAIALARHNINLARSDFEKGHAYNILGVSLRALGERESVAIRISESIEFQRTAQNYFTQIKAPQVWAMIQSNIGEALRILGDRSNSKELFSDSVKVHQSAIDVRRNGGSDIELSRALNGLGVVLQRCGEHEGSHTTLSKAKDALLEALSKCDRSKHASDWSMIQNNIGICLAEIAKREDGTESLEKAVDAYRAALDKRPREHFSYDWAMTQHNLGSALRQLGERKNDVSIIKEAIFAFREALKIRRRDQMPYYWAMTQGALGNALKALGIREAGTESLAEAAKVISEEIEELSLEGVSYNLARAQNNLGTTLTALGERESNNDSLDKAIKIFEKILYDTQSASIVEQWAIAQLNLSDVYVTYFHKMKDRKYLSLALSHVNKAFGYFNQTEDSYHKEICLGNIAWINTHLFMRI